MMQHALVHCLLLSTVLAKLQRDKPNIVWFLTDDQDQLLGGSFPNIGDVTPMPKTKRLLADAGITAENWYIHTPICSPSRSELVTGRYFHNIKAPGMNGGGYCSGMHVNYSYVNDNTFARVLKEEGNYTVGMFGKYLNRMPKTVPPGFDAWLANGGGTYIAPAFMTKNIDGLPDGHWKGSSDNYSTAVIGNTSIAWIRKVLAEDPNRPFMAYIAPKAAHEPFIPAPWHLDHWDPSWPDTEPRTANWNCSSSVCGKNHHGNIATEPLITDQASKVITGIFKNRWRTLMSVDDVIAAVIAEVETAGQLDNTYFFYSSDHGFQLGQFNIPMDKRHVYEWDTKIHLLARGPGIRPGSTFAAPGTQVDIAPTFLGLAGLAGAASAKVMDGRSIVPFLIGGATEPKSAVSAASASDITPLPASAMLPESVQRHLAALGESAAYAATWRDEVFIEYYYCQENIKCVSDCTGKGTYPRSDTDCTDLSNNSACWTPICKQNCYKTEDTANNFIGLRSLPNGAGGAATGKPNTLYAEFQTGDLANGDIKFDAVDFIEYYDVAKDPWEVNNLATTAPASVLAPLKKQLHKWFDCSGASCP